MPDSRSGRVPPGWQHGVGRPPDIDETRQRGAHRTSNHRQPRPATPAAHAVELRKTYGTGQATVHALAGITVTFERGRFTAVMGPSGSGKSTLMHCMAGLDRPTSGQTFVGDLDIGRLDDKGLTQLRRDRIGFVFQSFNLVPTLTAGENITLPADLAGQKVDQEWFDYLVDQLGHRRPAVAPAQRDVGRPAAALRLRPGPDQPARPRSSPTSRPGTSTRTPPPRCWPSCAAR